MRPVELLRYERGLSREQVAIGSGVPARTIRAVERETQRPTPKTAKALADFYGVSVSQILGLEQKDAA
jgi:transcriptional regulator with XRE-family HTH domain